MKALKYKYEIREYEIVSTLDDPEHKNRAKPDRLRWDLFIKFNKDEFSHLIYSWEEKPAYTDVRPLLDIIRKAVNAGAEQTCKNIQQVLTTNGLIKTD